MEENYCHPAQVHPAISDCLLGRKLVSVAFAKLETLQLLGVSGELATLSTPLTNHPDGDSNTVGVSKSQGSALGLFNGECQLN